MTLWFHAVSQPTSLPCLHIHKPLSFIIHFRVLSEFNFRFEMRVWEKFGHLPFCSLWALLFPTVAQNYQQWLSSFICICLNSLRLSFFCVRRHKSIYSSLWLSADTLTYFCLQFLLTKCILTFHVLSTDHWHDPIRPKQLCLIPFYSLWARINKKKLTPKRLSFCGSNLDSFEVKIVLIIILQACVYSFTN